MTTKLLSIDKLPSKSIYWTMAPYQSKVNMANIDKFLDIYVFEYQVDDRKLQGIKINLKDADKKLPVIIYCRGGNNVDPLKADMGISLPILNGSGAFQLALKGYCIYSTQLSGYGLNSGKDEFGGEDLNDIIALKDLIDNDPLCDNNKVGMLGYSRGGMMTYNVMTKVDWLKTVATVGGPTNLFRDAEDRKEMLDGVYTPAFGATKEGMRERSIVFNIDKLPKDANILIQHGEKDWRVNPLDSTELAEKLNEAKINHKLIVYPEDDHGVTANKKQRDQEILDWFNKYL